MCCGQSQNNKTDKDFTFCAVMKDMPVNKTEAKKQGRFREYKGENYYLCCDGCVNDFDTKPQIYAS